MIRCFFIFRPLPLILTEFSDPDHFSKNRQAPVFMREPVGKILFSLKSGFFAFAYFAEVTVGKGFVTFFVVALHEGFLGFFAGDGRFGFYG